MEIMILDDEMPFIQSLLRRVDWAAYGIDQVHTAVNGRAAREILAAHPVDLMLCDIEMPQEDGLHFFESVQPDYPELACIFVTCHPKFDYARSAFRLGSVDYILKPIDFSELDGILRRTTEKLREDQSRSRKRAVVEEMIDKVPEDSANELVAQVQRYLAAHLDEPISVERLADMVHLSPTYLMRLFKKECGASIVTYVTRLKLDLAKQLLLQTDMSVKQICDRLSYMNPSYFNRIFKSDTGMTPQEYRGSAGK